MAVSICVFAWGKTLLLKGLIWKTNRILALLLLTFSWGCEGPKTGDFYAKPNHSAEAEPPAVSINAPSSENLGSWVSFYLNDKGTRSTKNCTKLQVLLGFWGWFPKYPGKPQPCFRRHRDLCGFFDR